MVFISYHKLKYICIFFKPEKLIEKYIHVFSEKSINYYKLYFYKMFY